MNFNILFGLPLKESMWVTVHFRFCFKLFSCNYM